MKQESMSQEEDVLVIMTDEDGNEYKYIEEMILPVDGQNFALLTEVTDHEDHDGSCDCGCGEDAVIIAKIIEGDDGEAEYVEPTDEEFELVQKTYDAIVEDED